MTLQKRDVYERVNIRSNTMKIDPEACFGNLECCIGNSFIWRLYLFSNWLWFLFSCFLSGHFFIISWTLWCDTECLDLVLFIQKVFKEFLKWYISLILLRLVTGFTRYSAGSFLWLEIQLSFLVLCDHQNLHLAQHSSASCLWRTLYNLVFAYGQFSIQPKT